MTLAEITARLERSTHAADYTVTVAPCFAKELDLWSAMAESGFALPFQSRDWLEAWSATIGQRDGMQSLGITVRDRRGKPIVGLPLVRERRRLSRIGFADGGLSDYNAPILGRGAPQDSAGAAGLWRALVRVLPRADVIRFERMPDRLGPLANPFTLLPGARPASTNGLALHLSGSYEDWRQGRPRRYRMELGRCARLFDALPEARFEHVVEASGAQFEALEHLQRERIDTLDLPYTLDQPDARDFYRKLASRSRDGSAVLTTLVAGGQVIAGLFGLRRDASYVMLRIGADANYSRMSPARLLITRTIEMLRVEGVEHFDFGLGDYDYKRRLGASPVALYDLVVARSPLGLAETAAARVGAAIRSHPRAHAAAKAVRAKFRR